MPCCDVCPGPRADFFWSRYRHIKTDIALPSYEAHSHCEMSTLRDVEGAPNRPIKPHDEERYNDADENQALLSSFERDKHTGNFQNEDKHELQDGGTIASKYQVGAKKMSSMAYWSQLVGAFAIGVLCTVAMHFIIAHCSNYSSSLYHDNVSNVEVQVAPPYVGSTEVHQFPPAEPTNKFPELFPSNVGYGGATPTGAEPAIVATAPTWPMHTGAPHLVVPSRLEKSHNVHHTDTEQNMEEEFVNDVGIGSMHKHGKKKKQRKFSMLEKWGNLSPWFSIQQGGFGLDSSARAPDTCRVIGLHFLHRHGARYPDDWGEFTVVCSHNEALNFIS